MKKVIIGLIVILCFCNYVNICHADSYTNIRPSTSPPNQNIRDLKDLDNKIKRGSNKDVLLLLAISGGGSRAAYFGASVMLALQREGILDHVDVISAVSGGNLPAAYYAISNDTEWNETKVKEIMGDDIKKAAKSKYYWHVINPYAHGTRSDIMAEVFDEKIFQKKKFKDVNPERPYLIINATVGTEDNNDYSLGDVFAFTSEDFKKLDSNIYEYSIASAIMASSAYPGAFDYVLLRDWTKKDQEFLHLFDGGNADNLGLEKVKDIIKNQCNRYKSIIVILIDAHKAAEGERKNNPNPTGAIDRIVDFNFLDSFDIMLDDKRDYMIMEFKTSNLDSTPYNNLIFWHITFDDKRLVNEKCGGKPIQEILNKIPTDLQITVVNKKCIDQAVNSLISENNKCLTGIKQILQKTDDTHLTKVQNDCRNEGKPLEELIYIY
jgi:NTE family protein